AQTMEAVTANPADMLLVEHAIAVISYLDDPAIRLPAE
ncbi:hypothetical protein AVEN_173315-1, partial [Araneus ventricosus]